MTTARYLVRSRSCGKHRSVMQSDTGGLLVRKKAAGSSEDDRRMRIARQTLLVLNEQRPRSQRGPRARWLASAECALLSDASRWKNILDDHDNQSFKGSRGREVCRELARYWLVSTRLGECSQVAREGWTRRSLRWLSRELTPTPGLDPSYPCWRDAPCGSPYHQLISNGG